MMKTRREFLKSSGTLMTTIGVLGLAGQLDAQVQQKGAVKLNPASALKQVNLDKNNLGMLTNNLFQSPAERSKFVGNPQGYAEAFLNGKLDPGALNTLSQLRDQFAGGFCCSGCGCNVPARAVEISNPAAR